MRPDAALIARSLGTQIQSLKLRAAFADDPVDTLMAALALLGVALCDQDREAEISARLEARSTRCSTGRSTKTGCTARARPRCS